MWNLVRKPITGDLVKWAIGIALMIGGGGLLIFMVAAVALSKGMGLYPGDVVIACGYPVPWILLGYLLTFYRIDKTTRR